MALVITGCATHSRASILQDRSTLLEQARQAFEAGEYYRARKQVEELLQADPGDAEAEQLAAEVLEAEIARHKEVLGRTVPEEYGPEENSSLAKTWLERARMLETLNQPAEALIAAEKVFLYEPDNREASALIDRVQGKLRSEGKEESLFVRKIYEDEVDERVERYKSQAAQWLAEGKLGAARLAAEKAILLNPSDEEAERLYRQIKDEQEVREV
jgi:tetratricopeptide (TPR) repeat protein